MEKSSNRLDRPTFWMWVVPLVLGHFFLAFLTLSDIAGAFAYFDNVLFIFLAIALARRFRDIGWPVWIGPTILLVTMLALPFLFYGLAIANHAGDEIVPLLSLYGLLAGLANLVLLVVAGSVSGKPAPGPEIAHVFE
jgi:hypothetical protein